MISTCGSSRLACAAPGFPFLSEGNTHLWTAKAIKVDADGLWSLAPGHPLIHSARQAVRDHLEKLRRWERQRPDPALIAAYQKRAEEASAANDARLSRLRRVILWAFPSDAPVALVAIDVSTREMTSWIAPAGGEAEEARRRFLERLADYDFIAALGVHQLLRRLDFDPGDRHLADLGPPQKSMTINRQGRTLKITADLVVQGSCGITRPFGDPDKLRGYLRYGQATRFRRRLEADAKSVFALYQ